MILGFSIMPLEEDILHIVPLINICQIYIILVNKKYSNEIYMFFFKKGEFNTIEGFYSFYSFLKKPSEVINEHKLMLFRKECKPLWEVYIR